MQKNIVPSSASHLLLKYLFAFLPNFITNPKSHKAPMTDPKTAPIIGITLIPSSINKAVKVKILELILAIIKLDILFEFLSLLLIL